MWHGVRKNKTKERASHGQWCCTRGGLGDERTFATDVVAGREEDGPEPEHELAQEAGLRVLEDLHSFERVQMNVNGNLRFQFVCTRDRDRERERDFVRPAEE